MYNINVAFPKFQLCAGYNVNKMKTLIQNALLYDGSGGEPCVSDVLFEDEKIVSVGRGLAVPDAFKFNASGLALAPGFIDVHSHSDASILASPEAFGKISQGVTSEIVGNCGLSVFPANDEVSEHLNGLYKNYDVKVNWSDLRGYRLALEHVSPSVNIGSLCGHNTLRGNVTGYHDTAVDSSSVSEMKRLLCESFSMGAFGISTGLLYVPGKFAHTDELLEIMSVLKGTSRVYATHMRNEGDSILEALEEAVLLARAGSGRLEISHLKTAFERNWGKLDSVISMINLANRTGLRVTADRYPYTYGQTNLSVILPPPYDSLPDAEIQARLSASPSECEKVLFELEKRDFWDGIILTSSNLHEYSHLFGMYFPDAARAVSMSCAELTLELTKRDSVVAMASFVGLSQENMRRILSLPFVCCGSDENARPADYSIGRGHPRAFGSFPRFMNIVRDCASLPEAVRRVTSLPASIFGIRGRGAIRAGMYADMVLFDPEKFTDNADFRNPHAPASGICHVFVNGVLSYTPGGRIGRAGRFLVRD